MKVNNIIALCGAALVSTAPAFAGFNQGDTVTLGGQPIFHVAACDGMSAQHRAWVTQDRLDNALFLSANDSPSAVSVAKQSGAINVLVGGRRVITADANSARAEGLSADQLADRWAGKIKGFLSQRDRAAAYIASLKRPNRLAADVAVVERKLYAPAGTILPVTLNTAISANNAKVGDSVEGVVSQDVKLGNYAIPCGTKVIGELVEQGNGTLGVQVTSLQLASGTQIAISGTMRCNDYYVLGTAGPHPVCTLDMPANELIGARVPATIGVGSAQGSTVTTVAIVPGSSQELATGQQFAVVLDNVTPVAVITNVHMM